MKRKKTGLTEDKDTPQQQKTKSHTCVSHQGSKTLHSSSKKQSLLFRLEQMRSQK